MSVFQSFFGGSAVDRLLRAAQKGNLMAVRKAIAKGADINAGLETDKWDWPRGTTALMMAAARGYPQIVKVLLEADARVNDDGGHRAPLILAIEGNWKQPSESFTEVVNLLLENGADPNVEHSFFGKPVLMFAVEVGQTDVVRLLLEKGANPDDKRGTALAEAVIGGHTEIVKLLLEKGVDVNATFGDGRTVLKLSCDERIRNLLVEHGAVEPKEKKMWWAYLHKLGTIEVKSWHQFNTYIQEARTSPEVKKCLEAPFEADSREEAERIARRLLSDRR
jgi:ankyrin repeat protein